MTSKRVDRGAERRQFLARFDLPGGSRRRVRDILKDDG